MADGPQFGVGPTIGPVNTEPLTPAAATVAAGNPASIHADRAAGTLDIEWRDGHATRYDAVTLRWLCPCAFCRERPGCPAGSTRRPS